MAGFLTLCTTALDVTHAYVHPYACICMHLSAHILLHADCSCLCATLLSAFATPGCFAFEAFTTTLQIGCLYVLTRLRVKLHRRRGPRRHVGSPYFRPQHRVLLAAKGRARCLGPGRRRRCGAEPRAVPAALATGEVHPSAGAQAGVLLLCAVAMRLVSQAYAHVFFCCYLRIPCGPPRKQAIFIDIEVARTQNGARCFEISHVSSCLYSLPRPC